MHLQIHQETSGSRERKAAKEKRRRGWFNEYQIKIIALKTTSNISTLIRDLFHSPPIFRSTIQLSWIEKKFDVS